MPDYPAALEIIKRADSGLFILVAFTLYGVFALLYLSHKHATLGPRLERYGAVVLPVITLPINAPLAVVAAVTAFVSKRIALPYHIDPLALALAVGGALRFPLLFDSLWYDEAFTAQIVGLQPSQWFTAIMSDVHPPVYYFLLGIWRLLAGSSPFMLRLPSFVLSLAAVYLIYRLARGLGQSEKIAGIAAGLVAILPAAIYYGVEARSYALLTVLVLIGMIAIVERRTWMAGAVVALLCWTHNVGFFYAGALGVGALIYWSGDAQWRMPLRAVVAAPLPYLWQRWRFLLPLALGAMVGALWLPSLLIQSAYVQDGHWAYITPGAVFWPLINMTIGLIGQDFNPTIVIPVIGLTAVSLWTLRPWLRTRPGLLWLIVVLGVPAAEAAISFIWKPIYVYRHFLPATMILMIAWASVLTQSRLAVRVMAPVLVISLLAFYTQGVAQARPDYNYLLQKGCGEASAIYATSINAAFLSAQNDTRPTLVWEGAQDNGATVEPGALRNFDLRVMPWTKMKGSGATICIMLIDIPATKQTERDFVQRLLNWYPHETTEFHFSEWNQLHFYVLTLPDETMTACEPLSHCFPIDEAGS